MVLKEKEDLCNWFKLLHPRKRIDYMCGLLHLCLPLELRFIGTVLEDIAKKDFNYLRDAENKANNPSEWTSDGSQSFADRQFRAKIQVNLALMHSADGSCADILFAILEKQLSNLTNYLQDEQVLEEILTILTLACHHPAFKIKQRLRLGEILKNAEDHCQHLWENPVFPKHFQTCSSVHTSPRPTKDITSIFVNGIRDEVQNKKSGPDYEIHTSWSNGEVTQHFMKHKELQNLHNQIFNKFPDEKRLQHLFPSVPAQRRYRHESKEEKISTINSYFSELSKAQRILDCHILTRAFQNGKPITAPIQMSQSLSQSVYYPQYVHDNRFYGHFPDGYRVACYSQPQAINMMTMPATVLSSATTSPSNSRSSSPSITINNNNNNKSTRTVPDTVTVSTEKSVDHSKVKAGLQLQQQIVVDALTPTEYSLPVEMAQLLKLLDLEKYSKILGAYTLRQLHSMVPEEMAKLGLPPDALIKLQSRLDPQKHSLPDMNGVIQVQGPCSAKQERVMHSFPSTWQGHGHMPPIDPTSAQSNHPPAMPYPIHQFHLVSPQNAIPSPLSSGPDNSPCASDQCTPSLSPGVNSLPDSPPSSLASPTSVYSEDKNAKNHQVDSSGSEEDKVRGQSLEGNESALYRGRGPNRPQQSISLPLLNSNASSPGIIEKGKVMGVAASLSAPVVANEAVVVRDAGTPPMVPTGVINGFGPENSFMHPFVLALHQSQQHQHHHHRFKSAQPTHMGPRMHKNVVNMPCVDMNTQPPPPTTSLNKNPIMLHHPSYIIQPNSNMIHPQQSTNNAGSPQQLPSGQTLMPPALTTADNPGNMTALPFIPTIVPTGSNYMPPHSHSVMTSNSSIMSTHPQQHQQPSSAAASHSPSPVTPSTSVQSEQTQQPVAAYIHSNTGGDGLMDGRHEESHSATPTPTNKLNAGHNNTATNNGTLSHIPTMTGPGSGTATPSPPLHQPPPPPPKPIASDSSSHPQQHQTMFVPPPPLSQMYMIPNINPGNVSVTMPPYSTNPHQQQNTLQQHFPNGITPEVYHFPRFQLPMGAAGQLPPFFYGSQAYNPNPHIHHNSNNGNGIAHHATGSGNGGAKTGGKNSCYNCGSSGHKANECKESPMDSMTKSYRLNIKPKSDSD